ncbi:hypothetical protein EC957_006357 [Mortierella hygrophila]|uniref:Alcohol dehydrogenase-like N-terminal domain-containing protein n=1 Tax=Mortierella hygrophila TaxID=979708 RepID=A0A9P6JYN0_9FUNG|nr:hypothetical protein EC957_006357 [Mortierella hygrophila]
MPPSSIQQPPIFTGVNYIDIVERKTSTTGGTRARVAPFIPGHEASGEVRSEAQYGFKVGERVAIPGSDTCAGLVRMGHTVQKSDWIVIHTVAGGGGLFAAQLAHHLGPHAIDSYKYTRRGFDGLYGELAEYLVKGQLKVHVHKVFVFDEAQHARLDIEGRKSAGKLLIMIA